MNGTDVTRRAAPQPPNLGELEFKVPQHWGIEGAISAALSLSQCHSPYNHPNIKRLRGSFTGCWRYRVGDWRVVYQVDEAHQVITVLLIAHRNEVYR